MGVLVGTSLIVIIPEGIEAIYTAGLEGHMHTRRELQVRRHLEMPWMGKGAAPIMRRDWNSQPQLRQADGTEIDPLTGLPGPVIPGDANIKVEKAAATTTTSTVAKETDHLTEKHGDGKPPSHEDEEKEHHSDPPTFYIGLSLILGFVLMFLIDKLPRHASENLQPPPPTRHISLDNLSQGLHSSSSRSIDGDESESFLQSLTPSPKQTRSLATTTGLVIHAAADGIAMGASASTSNTKLGFIIFLAIMIHKAPAAFGLTSVLLKQGLSKRAARGHLIIFSLAAPFGALTTWLMVHLLGGVGMEGEKGQWWTGMLLLFSAGTFL
jgi:solute carrier family 39 (zinc transporter), member 9